MNAPFLMLGIAEMADRYNVTLRTLRFYEQAGLLQPIRQGNNRLYAPKDQVRLELILKGKRLGFTLHEIWKLLEQSEAAKQTDSSNIVAFLDKDMLAKQTRHLERRKAEIEKAITELQSILVQRAAVA